MIEQVLRVLSMRPGKSYFCRKSKAMEPNKDALLQHTKRALFQAGIWTSCMQTQQAIPSPHLFSWTKASTSIVWVPLLWMKFQKHAVNLCKGDCSNCKCSKNNLTCSPLWSYACPVVSILGYHALTIGIS